MRIVREQNIAGTATRLVFTKAEQAALRRAEKIADDARALLRSEFGEIDAEQMGCDTDLAHIAIGVDEVLCMDEDRLGVTLLWDALTPSEIAAAFRGVSVGGETQ